MPDHLSVTGPIAYTSAELILPWTIQQLCILFLLIALMRTVLEGEGEPLVVDHVCALAQPCSVLLLSLQVMHDANGEGVDAGPLPALQAVLRAEGLLPSWLHNADEVADQETKTKVLLMFSPIRRLLRLASSGWKILKLRTSSPRIRGVV